MNEIQKQTVEELRKRFCDEVKSLSTYGWIRTEDAWFDLYESNDGNMYVRYNEANVHNDCIVGWSIYNYKIKLDGLAIFLRNTIDYHEDKFVLIERFKYVPE
jgi:hypothetical protein